MKTERGLLWRRGESRRPAVFEGLLYQVSQARSVSIQGSGRGELRGALKLEDILPLGGPPAERVHGASKASILPRLMSLSPCCASAAAAFQHPGENERFFGLRRPTCMPGFIQDSVVRTRGTTPAKRIKEEPTTYLLACCACMMQLGLRGSFLDSVHFQGQRRRGSPSCPLFLPVRRVPGCLAGLLVLAFRTLPWAWPVGPSV